MIRAFANRPSSWTMAKAFQPQHPQITSTNITSLTAVRGMATKKAGGSTNNGRDSAGRRLGVKILHNQPAKAGSILVRQRGQKFRAGDNVGIGKDHTLFARVAGMVKMEKIRLGAGSKTTVANNKKRIRNVVSVVDAM